MSPVARRVHRPAVIWLILKFEVEKVVLMYVKLAVLASKVFTKRENNVSNQRSVVMVKMNDSQRAERLVQRPAT